MLYLTGVLTLMLLAYLLVIEQGSFGKSLLALIPVIPFVLVIYVYFLTQKVVISDGEISSYTWLWFKKSIHFSDIEKWSVLVDAGRSNDQLKPMLRLEIHPIDKRSVKELIIGLRPFLDDDVNRIIDALPSNKDDDSR